MASRRKRKHEEHLNHEAWAIPYADLITLLLAFFVVMYAISSVNEGKFRVLSNSLMAAFRGTPRTLQPIQIGKNQPSSARKSSNSVINSTIPEESMLSGAVHSLVRPVEINTNIPTPQSGNMSHDTPLQSAHQAAQALLLKHVANKVVRALEKLVRAKLVFVKRAPTFVQVEIRTDILYPSGSAKLSQAALPVIKRLGDILRPFPNPILVEGDTDNRPIHTVAFPSNWELSAARAASVVRRFVGAGVKPSRMAVVGHAQYDPIASNATAGGRNANRRVDIVILSTNGSVPQTVRTLTDPGLAPTTIAPLQLNPAGPSAAKVLQPAAPDAALRPTMTHSGTVSAP